MFGAKNDPVEPRPGCVATSISPGAARWPIAKTTATCPFDGATERSAGSRARAAPAETSATTAKQRANNRNIDPLPAARHDNRRTWVIFLVKPVAGKRRAVRRRLLVLLTALLFGACAAVAAQADNRLLVGVDEDGFKSEPAAAVRDARRTGFQAFRITLLWARGEQRLSGAETRELRRTVRTAAGLRPVLAVYTQRAVDAPTSVDRRDQYCAFVRSALVRVPGINDVVIWNEPNPPGRFGRGRPPGRDAFASRMIDRGISATVLVALMVHETSAITERRYIHLFDGQRTDDAVRQAMSQ